MQDNQTVTDVAFTETPREEAATPFFNPVTFLTQAFENAGLFHAAAVWAEDIDPRAETAEGEKDRIFFANRALRLFLAEVPDRENITPRMLLADGIDGVKWVALMEQGVIPWLQNQFDKKGKRVAPEAATEDSPVDQPEAVVMPGFGAVEQLNVTTETSDEGDGFVNQPPTWTGTLETTPTAEEQSVVETGVGDYVTAADITTADRDYVTAADITTADSAPIVAHIGGASVASLAGIASAEQAVLLSDKTAYGRGQHPAMTYIDDAPFVVGVDPATGNDQTVIVTSTVGRLEDGQWVGEPLANFPVLQEEIRKGLEDGSLQAE
jgi:hypothetical protein